MSSIDAHELNSDDDVAEEDLVEEVGASDAVVTEPIIGSASPVIDVQPDDEVTVVESAGSGRATPPMHALSPHRLTPDGAIIVDDDDADDSRAEEAAPPSPSLSHSRHLAPPPPMDISSSSDTEPEQPQRTAGFASAEIPALMDGKELYGVYRVRALSHGTYSAPRPILYSMTGVGLSLNPTSADDRCMLLCVWR